MTEPTPVLDAPSRPSKGTCQVCGSKARTPNATYCEPHAPATGPGRKVGGSSPSSPPSSPGGKKGGAKRVTRRRPPNSKNAPGQDQWEKFLGDVAAYGSIMIGLWLVSDLELPADEKEHRAGTLALEDDEADAIMKPLARIVSRSGINAQYGNTVMENTDVLDMALNLFFYWRRIQPAVHDKAERNARRDGGTTARTTARPQPPRGGNDAQHARGANGSTPEPAHVGFEPGSQLLAD